MDWFVDRSNTAWLYFLGWCYENWVSSEEWYSWHEGILLPELLDEQWWFDNSCKWIPFWRGCVRREKGPSSWMSQCKEWVQERLPWKVVGSHDVDDSRQPLLARKDQSRTLSCIEGKCRSRRLHAIDLCITRDNKKTCINIHTRGKKCIKFEEVVPGKGFIGKRLQKAFYTYLHTSPKWPCVTTSKNLRSSEGIDHSWSAASALLDIFILDLIFCRICCK